MNIMVSARVPVELRDQVNIELQKIGSSPTELINLAYRTFLKTKKLPQEENALQPGTRMFSKKQLEEFKGFVARTTVQVPEEYFEGKSYKELLAERKRADYEALA